MKIVAIIQARMSSKRLPGKVLLPLCGYPVIEHVVRRVKECKKINTIVVATSKSKADWPIVNWCKKNKINFFQGSLNDVLDRYYKASILFKADIIVRVTGDCPVIDPKILDEVIIRFKKKNYDFYSLGGNFPDGLDCQVFTFKALKKSSIEAKLKSDREHVGTYIENTNRNSFKIGAYKKFKKLSHHRWTIDEPRDYKFLKKIFDKLFKNFNENFYTKEILKLLKKEPKLLKINSGIVRNAGYKKSIKLDSY